MDKQEHLNRIKAKCLANLALAEAAKITSVETMMHHVSINIGDWVPVKTAEIAIFIAACAGPAEAGWRSTIAAIDMWEALNENCRGWKDDNGCAGAALQHYHCAVAAILDAWPENTL